jgi:phospholipid/cholesterol/gamma-HCH transport system substrate-binding protein
MGDALYIHKYADLSRNINIMKHIEITVGLFVALGIVALLILAMKVSNLSDLYADSGYRVVAKFQNIGGLKVKSPVKMGGVRIGRVSAIHFDEAVYKAVVTMNIDSQYTKIPLDTTASIFTAGLLGEQYIGLAPGAEEEYLADNSEIMLGLTQSAVILEQLIGQFLYRTAAEGANNEK